MAALCCLQFHRYSFYVPPRNISALIYNHSAASLLRPHSHRTRRLIRTSRSSLNLVCRCSTTSTSVSVSGASSSLHGSDDDDDEEVVPLPLQYYPSKRKTKSKRRQLLIQIASGLFSLPLVARTSLALADDDAFRLYLDDVNKYQLLIPPDWQVGSGEGDGVRSLTAFYPQDSSSSNVSLVITGLGADFTRLESFGNVDGFAETLVGGLDRSWQRPPGVAAKLVNSKSANGLYYIEYTLQNPGESRRHLFSVLGISNNGWYNRLYTLTGQYVDEEAEKYGPTIEKAVASFRLI